MQQEASRKIGFSIKKTMSVAQGLYEGVKIPEQGTVGLITYMRTDSTRISEEARNIAKKVITETYGEKYYENRYYKTDIIQGDRPITVKNGVKMTRQELYEKAKSLPLLPGVYIIRDKNDEIIYIGKAKELRKRVSQYFKEGAEHLPKVQKMVDNAFSFDVIVTNSEFEALTLECSQIKLHSPKYNILLKDDKGYNFIKISILTLQIYIKLCNFAVKLILEHTFR